jgi:hypothetical protein
MLRAKVRRNNMREGRRVGGTTFDAITVDEGKDITTGNGKNY